MKQFITFCLLVFSMTAFSQTGKEIFKRYQAKKEIKGVAVSGFMIRTAAKLSGDVSKEDMQLLKKIKKIRVLHDESNGTFLEDLKKELTILSKKEIYRDMAQIKEDGAVITVYAHPKGKKSEKGIDEFIFLIKDRGDQIAALVQGDFSVNNMKKLLKQVNN